MLQQNIAHNLNEKTRSKDVILDENVSFKSLMLADRTLSGLTECGFIKPSPIQLKSIPLGRCGFDLIVKSKAGTGKTLVFGIVALEVVNEKKNQLQVLILVPTREIAVQIENVLKALGKPIEGLVIDSFIGGLSVEQDVKKIKTCHIAIGCPGRIKHLLKIKALCPDNIRLFVLDEADKLLESSFQSDINEIFNVLPERKQVIASSATYPEKLDVFLTKYMLSPTHVNAEVETPVLLGIKQFVAIMKTSSNVVQLMQAKNENLIDILSSISFTQCLVFSNYQTRTESISNFLNQKGWNSIYISAAQSQVKRLQAINNLKEFKNRILLSTDLTARGIDASNVDLVINYDIPQDTVTYLHRMGRAGRYGSSGICINLTVQGNELVQLQHILATIGPNISIAKLPPLKQENFNIWKVDLSGLEQIQGKLSENLSRTSREDIHSEIMRYKQDKKTAKSKKSDEIEKQKDSTCVKNMLNSSKKEIESACKKYSDIDSESIFLKLASGEKIEPTTEIKEEVKENAEIILQSLLCTEEETKKRKRVCLNEQTPDLHKEKRKNETEDVILCKNTALLNTTKLLCNPNTNIDADLVNSIEKHLSIVKNYNDESTNNFESVEEILNQFSTPNNPKQTTTNLLVENSLTEDIFKLGYESAISNKNWKETVQNEYEIYKKSLEKKLKLEMSESEFDEEEDEEVEEEEEEDDYYENNEIAAYRENTVETPQLHDPLQWVPVVRREGNVDLRVNPTNEHFQRCYQESSDNLWQNGLTFENVSEFDSWFYQWQEQLKSVTSYVQQNIYIQEMSKYQHSRMQ